MNKLIVCVLISLLICSCVNRNKNINTTNEKESFDFADYYKNHSYVLVFSFDETDACQICVLQILNRLSFLRNRGIKVFINGISAESRRKFPDFGIMPVDITHTIGELPVVPFIFLVDSTYSASRYFVPEIDQPQKLEQYLKGVEGKNLK